MNKEKAESNLRPKTNEKEQTYAVKNSALLTIDELMENIRDKIQRTLEKNAKKRAGSRNKTSQKYRPNKFS